MNINEHYRIIGDITIKSKTSKNRTGKGKEIDISYGTNETTNFDNVAIIQSYKPLTSKFPYFLLEIKNCNSNALISVGIASLQINSHAGLYNNTIGYHNNTGRIYTSWKVHANTLGRQYGKNNPVGIYVTYFGENHSTILLFNDNLPIATRYHFERNKELYFPTITFSGGRADVSVIWPEAIQQLPSITDISVSDWIRAPMCSYDSSTNSFSNRLKLEDLPIQSPMPLSNTFRYFVVTQEEISSTDGKGASVGLATFSPLKPTPTCSLMKDYYTWFAKTKVKVGNTIGWGILYDENCKNDKAEQLCLVFVMFNKSIIDTLFVLQPEGGFVPIVLLQSYATKVSIEKKDSLKTEELNKLRGYYTQMLKPAMEIYENDKYDRSLPENLFRKSEQVLLNIDNYTCRVSIPRSENTIHYVQFCQPLTSRQCFFFVELEKICEECQVIVGIASSKHRLNEAPGIDRDTIGYNSSTGILYSNRKDIGNMHGHKCKPGDTMGVEIQAFHEEMSVILFSKNFRPVGTRYLTLKDHSEYFPTILVESNGDPVELVVYWQTRVSVPPHYNLRNQEDWCLPDGTIIDAKESMFILPQHYDQSLCIQAPYSLDKKYNHFEIILEDKFSDNDPPPAIALCTASPIDPPPISQFRQDYLRFWPTGDAARYLKQGDRIGWGIIFPQEEENIIGKYKEQLIICYLTVNRTVGYVRVLYQPVGGFYPVIIAPPNINRIKMDFSGIKLSTDEFTPEQVQYMIADAQFQIEEEERMMKSFEYTGNENIYTPDIMNENVHMINRMNEHPNNIHPTTLNDSQNNQNVTPVKSSACNIL